MYGLWKNSTAAVSLALALGAIPAVAGVKVDNMIYNNAMYSSGVNGEFPDGWSAVYHKVMPEWKKSADGKSRTVLFVNHGENAASSDVRAFSSLYIQPGEQYRFRVKIRTKGVTRGRMSFVAFAPAGTVRSGLKNRCRKIRTGSRWMKCILHPPDGAIFTVLPCIYPGSKAKWKLLRLKCCPSRKKRLPMLTM